MAFSFTEMAAQIPTEAAAYEYLEGLRWSTGVPVCPHCGNKGANFIKPRSGSTRPTRTGAQSARRLWQCKACRKQFSAMTGTIFHGSKVPLRTWLFVLFEMCANKNGFAAREIERKYGVSPKTAWFMAHRLREAMRSNAPTSLLVGTIVADETYIGGKAKNRHHSKRIVPDADTPELVQPGTVAAIRSANAHGDKAIVLSLVDAETGEVRSRVVNDVTGHTLRKVIADQVAMSSSNLVTDEGSWYKQLGTEFASHECVNHSEDEYVRYTDHGIVTTNRIEGFFAQLKRSLDGTHHHVSRVHLHRYLTEFDFRYTTCKMTDNQRMSRLVDQAQGRRLTYKRTTGGY